MEGNGGYVVKECGLSAWLSLKSTEASPTTNRRHPPPHTPTSCLHTPYHWHDTTHCVRLINRCYRIEDRALFGWSWRGWRADGAESSLSNQRGCPWISSVVEQPCAPWRSFRQLSRTRPTAVLNSSLQRLALDEQLHHTGQFPYKPNPPASLP